MQVIPFIVNFQNAAQDCRKRANDRIGEFLETYLLKMLSEKLSTHLNFSPVEEGRGKSEGEKRGKAASNHPTCRATQLSEREEQVARIWNSL